MSKFEIAQHAFTSAIIEVLQRHFGEYAEDIFQASSILGYLNNKTKAANRGSKARGAFANHYALYVVVEDYIKNGFADGKAAAPYSKCQGIFHPAVYEFHHLDPTTKDRDPSKMLSLKWERVTTELDKCILLCANCHRLIHHESNY